jgi:RNA polymerase sigma-70 factor (ECF subfamily)
VCAVANRAAVSVFAASRLATNKIRQRLEGVAKAMNEAANTAQSLWQALSGEMRVFLRSRLPGDSDADDVLQDVFVKVIESIGSLRAADRVESWVYQIARNALADFYRRRKLQPVYAIENVPATNHEDGSILNRAVGAWMSSMIDQLPETFRDSVRMYEIERVSQSDIAEYLKISLSAAKSRIQRGRQELEKLLLGCCKLELDRRGNIIECNPMHSNSCEHVSCDCAGESNDR